MMPDDGKAQSELQSNWLVIRLVFPYLLEFKHRIILALVCLVMAKVASTYIPFILKYTVDALENPQQQALLSPLLLVMVYGLLRFSNVILNELRDTLFGRVTERAIRRISLHTFEHLHQLDQAFHLNRRTGALSRDMERGSAGIHFVMRFMVFNIIPIVLEVSLVCGLLWYNYGWKFALITFIAVAFYLGFTMKATDWRNRFIRAQNTADSATNNRAVDSLLNYETVKYFGNEHYEAQRYDQELAFWEVAKRQNRLSLFALNAGQALIVALAMSSMLALAVQHIQAQTMTLGDFVLINAFLMQLFIPLNFLGFVYREIKASLVNIEKMMSLLDERSSIQDPAEPATLKQKNLNSVSLAFHKLSFAYKPPRNVLNNIDFSIPVGKKFALIGESGSGKSTISKLIFRFYDPQSGCITINGTDIRQLQQAELRALIGIVPQETVLFNDSIFENIRYGRPEASDDEVWNVIRLAHLQDFINSLPERENTSVGERGLKVSGGEKQRIAIARTLLKQPAILIFDEATSALDSHSEEKILQALDQVSHNITTLMIAHRLSSVSKADQIIVLHEGRIIEQGQHQALLEQQGHYAHLWALQQSKKKSPDAP